MNYQVCEPLTHEEYQALKASIARDGIEVPIVLDEHGDIIDGHHRMRAYYELKSEGVEVAPPMRDVRHDLGEAEKRNLARTLNAVRRQMSKEQRNQLIVAMREDGMSYRQIGEVVGVDAKTALNVVNRATVENSTVDLPATITGRDGKERPATKPAPVRYADVDDGWGDPGLDVPMVDADQGDEDGGTFAKYDCGLPVLDIRAFTTNGEIEDTETVTEEDRLHWEKEDHQEDTWEICSMCEHHREVKIDGEYRTFCVEHMIDLNEWSSVAIYEAKQTDFPPCYDSASKELRDFSDETEDEPRANKLAVHHSSETPEHYTPSEVIDAVIDVLGAISLDPCSNSHESPNVPALFRYTKDDDGLSHSWQGTVYMNPPYGRGIDQWVGKLVESYEHGDVSSGIALLPARPDTQWWQILRDYPCCFITGRLKFIGNDDPAPFPSAVFYLGEDIAAFYDRFSSFGDVWTRIDEHWFTE